MDESWLPVLEPYEELINSLLSLAEREKALPEPEKIFRALSLPVHQVRVIILGQDPYPTPGMAEGLAFSVPAHITKLPPSLKNIFSEYVDDLQLPPPETGHLGRWVSSGVLLLNRVLTVRAGVPLSHHGLGWEKITDAILHALTGNASAHSKGIEIPIICWGKQALTAAQSAGFSQPSIFFSPHPSPLSAHRGFFGSKPFSSVNNYLAQAGIEPIDWRI